MDTHYAPLLLCDHMYKNGFVYISHDLAALIEYLIALCYRKFNNVIIEIVLYSYQFKR